MGKLGKNYFQHRMIIVLFSCKFFENRIYHIISYRYFFLKQHFIAFLNLVNAYASTVIIYIRFSLRAAERNTSVSLRARKTTPLNRYFERRAIVSFHNNIYIYDNKLFVIINVTKILLHVISISINDNCKSCYYF